MLLPQGTNCETVEVPVSKEISKEPESKNGINEPTILLKQIHAAEAILDIKKPEKIITLGGVIVVLVKFLLIIFMENMEKM